MKKFLFISLLTFLSTVSFANHTKGGWMYYQYLGQGLNDPSKLRYKIAINLYVECGTAVPETGWTFSIFKGSSPYTLLQDIPVSQASATTIQNCILPECHPCIDNVPLICYWIKTYELVVELAPSTDGYIISKQRCCRVIGISNLQTPSNDFGETYTIKIPGSGAGVPGAQYNSSPKFIFNDTALVCANNYFSVNFTATDIDGDSLVYSFCDAYHGGDNTANGANPSPASPPPYPTVSYSGAFSGSRPLGSGITIDSKTGKISGIAPAFGEYVVCVCVAEYRNGIHFADSRKEIHLYVRTCNPVSAKLKPRNTTCDGFTVDFSNATEGINPVGTDFLWDFGDPASGASNTSILPNPVHTYTDTGIYLLKLKVSLSGQCTDSSSMLIKVYPGFHPGFTIAGQCKNTAIQFTDISTADFGIINKWDWDFGDLGSPTNISTAQHPTHIYTNTGAYNVTFVVQSSKGCIDTVFKALDILDKPPLSVSKDTLICIVDTLQLHAVGSGSFTWSPNYMINDINSPDPLVSPDVTTTYYVILTDPFGCVGSDSVKVNVKSFVTLFGGNDTTICKTDPVILKLTSDALHYLWTETPAGNTLNDPTLKNPTAIPLVTTTYHVVGNIGKCTAEDDIVVIPIPYPLANAGPDQHICFTGSAQLNASGGSIYSWNPTAFLTAANIPNPVSVNPTDNVRYVVTVRDVLGCPKPVRDTMILFVDKIKADAGPRDTSVVLGQPLQLGASGSINYSWAPTTWLNNPSISNPVSLPQSNIVYVVRVSNDIGCFDTDTILVRVYKLQPGLYVPNAFTPNGDHNNDIFRPIAIGMKSIDIFRVYNRWGQMLYSGTGNGAGWDGTFGGRPQEAATYVWYAEGVDYLNNKIKRKGSVVLIR